MLIFNAKDIVCLYKNIDKKTWIAFFIIIIAGLGVRLWVIPHMHHTYHDEFEHLSIAENLHFHHKYSETLQGTYNHPEETLMKTWPPGYHMILALSYNLFSVSENTAFNTTAVISALSILLMFLLAYALFTEKTTALYSAFLLALAPVHLKYSGSTSTEICSFFFLLLSLWTAALYAKYAKFKHLLLLIFTTAFAIYTRPENGILLLLIPLFVIFFTKRADFPRKKIIFHTTLATIILLPLISFYFLHNFYYAIFTIKETGWADSLPTRLFFLQKSLPGNLTFWFGPGHPASVTFLAIFGFIKLFKHKRRAAIFLSIWFCIFLLVYSAHYTGRFNSISDRHALNLYIPIILMAAYGIFALSNRWANKLVIKRNIIFILLASVFLSTFFPLSTTISKTLSDSKNSEYQFILTNKNKIPEDIYIISFNPNIIISSIHKKAITPFLFVNLENKPKKAILFQDYWYRKNEKERMPLENYLKKNYDFDILLDNNSKSDPCSLILLTAKKERPY
ncbi:MAG: DUF6541 family protein [Candidatus Omnitrophota bacterium]